MNQAPAGFPGDFPGDRYALPIPAHLQALRQAGAPFLTTALRASGYLASANRVTKITRLEECQGGSTGRKALLRVEYEKPATELHCELFVKFSRDFDDAARDRGRSQMELEIRFAQLSQVSRFPIAVPACLYADYHAATGTGILITERIAFGQGAIEPHYDKCLDDAVPYALEHYQALLTALARLAGTDKAGLLADQASRLFPFDPGMLSVSQRQAYTARQLLNRVARYADFAAAHPGLLPQQIRTAAFIARLRDEAPRFPEHMAAIQRELQRRPGFIALCHWNANIDNAWFWRKADGRLECGLMDWGCASQMHVAMAIWGSMSGAATALWQQLDALLALFITEFRRCGGPDLDAGLLKRHLMLYVAVMGLNWLMDVPAYLQTIVSGLPATASPLDPPIRDNEAARTRLLMLTNFLSLWQTWDFGRILDQFLSGGALPAAGA